MKKQWIVWTVLLVGVIAMASVFYHNLQPTLQISKETTTYEKEWAADFTVIDVSETKTRLKDHIGRPVIVNFWASWCTGCDQEMVVFEEMYKKYGNEVDFMMINVTDGDRETVASARTYIEKKGLSFPVYFDRTGQAIRAYEITRIPVTLMIDAQGKVDTFHFGTMDRDTLQESIERLISIKEERPS